MVSQEQDDRILVAAGILQRLQDSAHLVVNERELRVVASGDLPPVLVTHVLPTRLHATEHLALAGQIIAQRRSNPCGLDVVHVEESLGRYARPGFACGNK